MSNKIYRAGMIGMGGMGRTHASILMQIPDVKITSLCSYPIDDAESFANVHTMDVNLYADAHEMIESEDLDIVYICIPPYAHDGQLEKAVAKGIHVFIEKPIALSINRGKSMVDAAKSSHANVLVGYHMRHGSAVAKLKNEIISGRAGKPSLFTARYECNSLHAPWWSDVTKCGGQVFEQVIHLYDMALYLMGEPLLVSGFTANLQHQDVPGYTVEDTSVASICFENGTLGSITGSNCAKPDEWNATFRVLCENMIADFTDPSHATFTYIDGSQERIETLSYDDNLMMREDMHFMDIVRGKTTPMATISEGFTGLQMVSATIESSRLGGAPIRVET